MEIIDAPTPSPADQNARRLLAALPAGDVATVRGAAGATGVEELAQLVEHLDPGTCGFGGVRPRAVTRTRQTAFEDSCSELWELESSNTEPVDRQHASGSVPGSGFSSPHGLGSGEGAAR